MYRPLLACAVAIAFALTTPSTLAGKLYKIVDKNGNVTFSQFPPSEPQQDVQVDTVSVNNSNTTHITGSGNKLRCGSIGLPYIDKTKPEKMLELEELRAEWQRELESGTGLEEVTWRMQLSRYNITRDPAESGQVKRDLQCAIKWADNQKSDVANARQQLQNKAKDLDQKITRLKAQRDRACGTEPYLNDNEPATVARHERWQDCYYDNSDELYELESEASRLNSL